MVLRQLCAAYLVCHPLVAHAGSEDHINSGCPFEGASGLYTVDNGSGTRQEIIVLDEDGDGLPEKAWCTGGNAKTLTSGRTDCSTLDRLDTGTGANGENCDFEVDVWVGSANPDGTSSSPIDCSSNGRAVLMFGGGDVDYLDGTSSYGDFLHGGAENDVLDGLGGDDYLCAGEAGLTGGDTLTGGAGDDRIFGGRGADTLNGGTGDDTLMAAMSGDTVNCHQDRDACHGAFDDDTIDGGNGYDYIVGGKGDHTMRGDLGNDILISQDNFADAVVDGEGGTDTCWRDSNGGGPTDTVTSCATTHDLALCDWDYLLLVGTNDGSEATLNELDLTDGDRHESGTVSVGGVTIDEILGIAVDPVTCNTALLVQEGTNQKVVTLDTDASGQPSSGVYTATDQGDIPGDDMVDIAFGPRGNLLGLESDADLVILAAAVSPATDMTETSHGGIPDGVDRATYGVHLAYDGADAGMFFVMTSTEADHDPFEIDMFSPYNDVSMTGEHGIDWVEPWPFSFVWPLTDSGRGFTIDDTASGSGRYPMYHFGRRNWGGKLSLGSAVSDLTAWPGGAEAELDDPPDAIGIPHWFPEP